MLSCLQRDDWITSSTHPPAKILRSRSPGQGWMLPKPWAKDNAQAILGLPKGWLCQPDVDIHTAGYPSYVYVHVEGGHSWGLPPSPPRLQEHGPRNDTTRVALTSKCRYRQGVAEGRSLWPSYIGKLASAAGGARPIASIRLFCSRGPTATPAVWKGMGLFYICTLQEPASHKATSGPAKARAV